MQISALTFAHHGTRLDIAAKWMAVATSFSLVVSTALCSVTMILFLAFWIGAGHYREKLTLIRANPIALWSLALFMMFVIGVLYSSASFAQSLETLGKYRELLYIPLLLTAFSEPQWQRRGYYAFFMAVALMLLLSYAKLLGLLPLGPPEQEYAVFKNRIAHSILMAYMIYLSAQHLMHSPRWRPLWGLLITLSVSNLLFMIGGRSGYLIFFALVMLFMYQRWRWRGIMVSGLLVVAVAGLAYHSSSVFNKRMGEIVHDLTDEQPHDALAPTAGHLRLEFYAHTLQLIARHPWLGGGTGSFAPEYAELSAKEGLYPSANPHNEFLLVTTQLGLVGLTLLLRLGYCQWRLSYQLGPEFMPAAQGLIVAMAVGSLFNSLLLDFTEGHFYACLTGIYYGHLGNYQSR